MQVKVRFTFTCMHLADAFIQSDLQLHSGYTFSLVCSKLERSVIFHTASVIIHTVWGLAQNKTVWEREKKVSLRHTHCLLLNEWKGSVFSMCNSLMSCSEEVQPNGSRVSFMMLELMAPCVLYHWTLIMLSCHHNFFLRHEQLDKRNAQNKSSIELWVIGEESE